MVLFIQYALTDIRSFLRDDAALLKLPTWPDPTPPKEFVKASGKITKRKKSEQGLWVGEQFYSTLRTGIKIPKQIEVKDIGFKLKNVSKHYTAGDQNILSIYEFAYILTSSPHPESISNEDILSIINAILDVSLEIRNKDYKYTTAKFKDIRNPLIELQIVVSTKKATIDVPTQSESLIPCIPQFYFLLDEENFKRKPGNYNYPDPTIPKLGESIITPVNENINENPYQVWIHRVNPLTYGGYDERQWNRAARINMLRLYAEVQNMRNIFKAIAKEQIDIKPFSRESNNLQAYLKSSFNYLHTHETEESQKSINYTKDIFTHFLPDEIAILQKKLKNFNIRRHLEEKTFTFINSNKPVDMSTHYNINNSQVGAIGNGAQATNNTFNQTNFTFPANYDFDALARQLKQLKDALDKKPDKTGEDYATIGQVANAEESAKKKDGKSILEHLKTAGKWVFDTATEIGVELVAAIIQKQMGI